MSLPGFVPGLPGVRTPKSAVHRIVFRQGDWLSDLAGGRQIDGVNARDPGNNAPTDAMVLRPGQLMGLIASSKLYGTSVIDVTAGALAAGGTSITLSAAGATELVRRIGTSGNLTLTGPPAANGTARSLTVAFSVVNTTTGVVTITAPGINEVQTLDFANSPAGTFTLTVIDLNGVAQETAPITYSGTAATLVTNINNALNTVLGSSLVVASGSAVTAIALTFSGAGYAALPQPLVTVGSNELTAGTVSVTRTTAGVGGAFVAGSLVGPTDGSQTPLTLVPDGYGIIVTDVDLTTNLTVPFPQLPIAGVITTAQVLCGGGGYPTDTGIQGWIKNALNAVGKFVFDDSF